jgi:Flp pilus assembly protein TadG
MTSPRPLASRRKRQRGSAIVESTLCFLGFIFLTLGLMEFSMAVYAYNFVTYVASDAARYASLHATTASVADIKAYIRGQAVALVSSRLSIDEDPTHIWYPNKNAGSVVTIKVNYSIHPLVGLMIRRDLNVSSRSQVVIQH